MNAEISEVPRPLERPKAVQYKGTKLLGLGMQIPERLLRFGLQISELLTQIRAFIVFC